MPLPLFKHCPNTEQMSKNIFSSSSERGVTTTLTMERRGLFDVSVYKILEEDALRRETVFGCEVSIPGTSYRIREETMYFPGKGEMILRFRSTNCSGSESSMGCYISGLLTGSSL